MNWIQRFRVKLAAWANPSTKTIANLLSRATSAINLLSDQNDMLRLQVSKRREAINLEIKDLSEAIAMQGGGWLQRTNGKLSTAVSESDSTAVVNCKETIADLQLALEDRDWLNELRNSEWEFSRWGIQRIILLCRLYRVKNPLIQRGILVSSYYVFGRGFEISSQDETANEVIQTFLNDPRNINEIGQRALTEKQAAKFTDGNIFWCFFASPDDGAILIRTIDALEIQEIVTDPDDANVPRYYHRRWVEQAFNERSGVIIPVIRNEWYVAMGYDAPKGTTIEGKPLVTDKTGEFVPVYHVKSGALPKWKFGCPKAYAALDWARAYTRLLENYSNITEALARFSWQVETKGGPPAIAALKATLATTVGNVDGLSVENNPPPVTASAFVSGPGTKINPFRVNGSAEDPETGRRLALMLYCVFGLPETFFSDVSVGTLATATSLDRPTELGFLKEQEAWREDLQRIMAYVLERSATAPKGRLREALAIGGLTASDLRIRLVPGENANFALVKPKEAKKKDPGEVTIEVKFPSIIQGDELNRVSAIVDSMTLNGFECTGIDLRTGIGLLLTELGVEDVEVVLEAMFPQAEYDPKRTDELKAAKQLKLNPPEPPGPRDPTAKRPGVSPKEARAIAVLTSAAKALQEQIGQRT